MAKKNKHQPSAWGENAEDDGDDFGGGIGSLFDDPEWGADNSNWNEPANSGWGSKPSGKKHNPGAGQGWGSSQQEDHRWGNHPDGSGRQADNASKKKFSGAQQGKKNKKNQNEFDGWGSASHNGWGDQHEGKKKSGKKNQSSGKWYDDEDEDEEDEDGYEDEYGKYDVCGLQTRTFAGTTDGKHHSNWDNYNNGWNDGGYNNGGYNNGGYNNGGYNNGGYNNGGYNNGGYQQTWDEEENRGRKKGPKGTDFYERQAKQWEEQNSKKNKKKGQDASQQKTSKKNRNKQQQSAWDDEETVAANEELEDYFAQRVATGLMYPMNAQAASVIPSRTLAFASKTPQTSNWSWPLKGVKTSNSQFLESGGAALTSAHLALYGRARFAKDRIHWVYPPDKDPRVRSLLAWVGHRAPGLAALALHKFITSGTRGALIANADHRSLQDPDQPTFDWITLEDARTSRDRILQESIAFYNPAIQVVIFVFLLSETGNSLAIWRRKLPLPHNLQSAYGPDIQVVLNKLPTDYPIYVEGLPRDRQGKAKLSKKPPSASLQEEKKTKRLRWLLPNWS